MAKATGTRSTRPARKIQAVTAVRYQARRQLYFTRENRSVAIYNRKKSDSPPHAAEPKERGCAMSRPFRLSGLLLPSLAVLVFSMLCVRAQKAVPNAPKIPARPEQLHFPELKYQPPDPAQARVVCRAARSLTCCRTGTAAGERNGLHPARDRTWCRMARRGFQNSRDT